MFDYVKHIAISHNPPQQRKASPKPEAKPKPSAEELQTQFELRQIESNLDNMLHRVRKMCAIRINYPKTLKDIQNVFQCF